MVQVFASYYMIRRSYNQSETSFSQLKIPHLFHLYPTLWRRPLKLIFTVFTPRRGYTPHFLFNTLSLFNILSKKQSKIKLSSSTRARAEWWQIAIKAACLRSHGIISFTRPTPQLAQQRVNFESMHDCHYRPSWRRDNGKILVCFYRAWWPLHLIKYPMCKSKALIW